MIVIKNALKKVLFVIEGVLQLQGFFGSYWFLFGLMGAIPENPPGSYDYEEDMAFVPFGYAMLLIWVGVMVTEINV